MMTLNMRVTCEYTEGAVGDQATAVLEEEVGILGKYTQMLQNHKKNRDIASIATIK